MNNNFFSKVLMWLFIGLMITFFTGYQISLNENLMINLYNSGIYYLIILVQFGLVIFLSVRINKMENLTAKLVFMGYSFLTGLTLSYIYVLFELSSIIQIFGISSIALLIMGIIGYTTNQDLGKFRNFLYIGLIALILINVVNIFAGSQMLDFFQMNFGIVLFLIFIAYDIQKIKNMYGLSIASMITS
ncbi:MAG: Bax inhibitor-1/YccA family protein [Geovibrio sp.]|nr:Bax inhibitor-1/YccA family protein [Geovibrio sp.]